MNEEGRVVGDEAGVRIGSTIDNLGGLGIVALEGIEGGDECNGTRDDCGNSEAVGGGWTQCLRIKGFPL